MSNQNQSELNLPDIGTMVKPGRNAGAAAKPVVESEPEIIDLRHLYGEHGGLVGTSTTAGGESVDIAHLYGEFGGPVE
jgi:hypothetical protein